MNWELLPPAGGYTDGGVRMGFLLFGKKDKKVTREEHKGSPAIRCSICTGEQVAGFRDPESGRFEEVMLLRTAEDLELFKQRYGIAGDIEKIY